MSYSKMISEYGCYPKKTGLHQSVISKKCEYHIMPRLHPSSPKSLYVFYFHMIHCLYGSKKRPSICVLHIKMSVTVLRVWFTIGVGL